jgi:DNA-binding MarR family transcriptional regulator
MSKQHYQASTYRAQSSIGYLMRRGNSLLSDLMEPLLERRGFSFVQYVILRLLRDEIVVTPGDICRLYRYDSGALTRVIDQLAARGLVERLRGDRDRRKVELQLSAAGRRAVETLLPPVVEVLNRALADFSAGEVQELTRLLMKLNSRLQATLEPQELAEIGT